jgi:ribosomal protein S27AE
MPHNWQTEFGFDPEGLLEKYCPVCGELRPVRFHTESDGIKRFFCAKCQAPLDEEVEGGSVEPDSGNT